VGGESLRRELLHRRFRKLDATHQIVREEQSLLEVDEELESRER